MKTRPILIAALSLFLAGGATWWWQRTGSVQAIVSDARPPPPDLTAESQVLRELIGSADAKARSRLTAAKGLAELSRLYYANGFLAEAMSCYDGLEQLNPGEPRWPHLHATILAGYGEIESAEKLWQRVLQLAPDYVAARLRLGDCFLKTNKPDKAAAEYAEVLRRKPGDSYAMLGLARIDVEAARWEKARERLETVVQQTNFTLGYDLIVSVYEQMGQPERAAAIRGAAKASGAFRDPPDPWLDELLDACYEPYRLALSAGVSARIGDPAAAIRLLDRAIALKPDDVTNHFQLATVYLAQGDVGAARDKFQQCTALSPEFADAWVQLSALQVQLGENAAAESTLARGLRACPNSAGLHLTRARNLRKAGLPGEAITEFQNSIRLRPNEPDAYIELGNTYIALGNETEGIQQMRAALETEPGHPIALSVLAYHAITTGNETEARHALTGISHQPRIDHELSAQLIEAYKQAFGRDWIPDKPNE